MIFAEVNRIVNELRALGISEQALRPILAEALEAEREVTPLAESDDFGGSPPPMRKQLRDTVLRIRQLEAALRAAGVPIQPWTPSTEGDSE